MQQGNSAKTLVETWPPLIRDMQKVCQKISSFSCFCASKTHLPFSWSLLMCFCTNYALWPFQLLVFLLSKMAEYPTEDIWIGLRSIDGGEFHWTDGQPRKYIQNVLVVSVWLQPCLNCTQFCFVFGLLYPFIFLHFYFCKFLFSVFPFFKIHPSISLLADLLPYLSIVSVILSESSSWWIWLVLEWFHCFNPFIPLHFRTLSKREILIIFGALMR